jgi:hypothetical protein
MLSGLLLLYIENVKLKMISHTLLCTLSISIKIYQTLILYIEHININKICDTLQLYTQYLGIYMISDILLLYIEHVKNKSNIRYINFVHSAYQHTHFISNITAVYSKYQHIHDIIHITSVNLTCQHRYLF